MIPIRIGIFLGLIIAFPLSTAVHAQSFQPFSGKMRQGLYDDFLASACPDGYAHQCHSGNCQCTYLHGMINNPLTGNGTFTIEVTQEQAESTGDFPHCFPIYLFVKIEGAKDTMQWAGNGSECASLNHSEQPETINGGFEVTSSNLVTGGGGLFKGTINFDKPEDDPQGHKVTFSFKGKTY
jgi:hypothetical protein